MPVVLLDRLPLPSLPAYTAVSVSLLACSLYYAAQNAHQLDLERQPPLAEGQLDLATLCWVFGRRCSTILTFMIHEPFCIWPLVNMAYCVLVLLGKCIQSAVFGELRVSESNAIKDTFWNFVFYKFIFIFGVLSVQKLEEVVLWCSWFTLLGFLHHLAQLARERAEYLSMSVSPGRERWRHVRLLALLAAILLASGAMLLVCVAVGLLISLNTFAFMGAECILLTLRTLQTMLRYLLHLYDVAHSANPVHHFFPSVKFPAAKGHARQKLNEKLSGDEKSNDSSLRDNVASDVTDNTASSQKWWVRGGGASYYLELLFELAALLLDLLHHIHMLLWCNILLSMASLVICMQLRLLLHQLRARLARHRHRLRLQAYMRKHFPSASKEELKTLDDDCAICWESLCTARKLPCSHFFHSWCLQSWLEQDPSCPTCRMTLSIGDSNPSANLTASTGFVGLLGNVLGGLVGSIRDHDTLLENEQRDQPQQINNNAQVFHFDGSRYVSWLPSFSVEAAHSQLGGHAELNPSSQLHNMALQVQQMFPHYPLWVLVADLRVSHSAELTVENILEGRLLPPAPMFNPDMTETPRDPEPAQEQPSLFSDWQEESPAETATDPFSPVAFSDEATERQRTLAKRREALVLQARRRYLQKSSNSCEASASCSHGGISSNTISDASSSSSN
ncbi:E3 ubiquitin-protein ligase AMFR-like [Neocloeon triangulifer]|uniref:E3 ubiquitin-protein ligase AMFR-like n=1 Tax=Neocloeon triangulifer TaxID=2078957 RepID=UPI00286F2635|nr:E3 ubiquitin-protein ligase AMFR-like [Neocloeon triangulifer]XP_059476858.1 E3 ubiquitin-protein ligase AMFR-like [Neocloeon triangulifer]